MQYTNAYLQFGQNDLHVPCYEDDLILSNSPTVPVPHKLVECTNDNLWYLVFTYSGGNFYRASANVPAVDGAYYKSWYSRGGPGPATMAFTPFVIGDDAAGEFIQATNFVDFSVPSPSGNSVNMDTVTVPTVTATVHMDIPELSKVEVSTKAYSHSVVITTKTTNVVFDQIFVYAGDGIPVDNVVTLPKGHSCLALAVYRTETSVATKEVGTIQWPKIPKYEWPMIIAEMVKDIVTNERGDIYHYISPKTLMEADADTVRKATTAITKRVEELDKIKTVIAGLITKKAK